MPKATNKPLDEGKNPDELQTNSDLPEAPPDVNELLRRSMEREQALTEMVNKQGHQIARLEYSGGNKNKMRQFDEMTAADENIRFGHVPSFDGKEPIVDWEALAGGRSYIESGSGRPIDDQSWVCTTLSGEKKRIELAEKTSLMSGNEIKARCNNWQEYMAQVRLINKKQHDYQKFAGRTMTKNEARQLWDEIKNLQLNLKMNVTLSTDFGRTYEGETLDILAKMWNA